MRRNWMALAFSVIYLAQLGGAALAKEDTSTLKHAIQVAFLR